MLYFCLLHFGFLSTAQEPGMIDTTWYLRSITIDGEIDYVPTYENFNLQITETAGEYSVTASGVENAFWGNLLFDIPAETLEFTEVAITLGPCEVENCDYENLYFYEFLTDQSNELKTFDYSYFEFSNGTKRLRLTDSNGNVASYYDYPMPNPNPQTFQTWYVYASYVDLDEPNYFYGENVPQMTINEDFSFTAIDNCFEISGNFEYTDETDLNFGLVNLNYEKDCILGGNQGGTLDQIYQFQEGVMGCNLDQLSNGSYELSINTFPGFGLLFRNQITLSVPEQQRQKVIIFPNPANDKVSISGLQNPVEELQIYDVTGGLVKTFNAISGSTYDVSEVSPGIYFLKISSGGTTSMRKLIKK